MTVGKCKAKMREIKHKILVREERKQKKGIITQSIIQFWF